LGAWALSPNQRLASGAENLSADYPIDDSASAIKPLMWNGVGGSTINWGAHFPRLHPSDFRTRTLDGVGDDWPFSYFDLEPYYDANDVELGVAGLTGDPAYPPKPPRWVSSTRSSTAPRDPGRRPSTATSLRDGAGARFRARCPAPGGPRVLAPVAGARRAAPLGPRRAAAAPPALSPLGVRRRAHRRPAGAREPRRPRRSRRGGSASRRPDRVSRVGGLA